MSEITPIKAILESLQYANGFHAEEPKKDGISHGMKSVKPYTGELRHNKSPGGKRVNEGCPEPDIHYPTEDVTPDNAKDYEQLLIQVESSEIDRGNTYQTPGEHLVWRPWSLSEEEVGDESRYGSNHESSYRPEDVSGANYQIGTWLYAGYSGKGNP